MSYFTAQTETDMVPQSTVDYSQRVADDEKLLYGTECAQTSLPEPGVERHTVPLYKTKIIAECP